MYSVALVVIAALHPAADSTAAIEGVWVDGRANLLFAGNGRVDWQVEDRFYTALLDQVPDGTLFGNQFAGRDLFVGLNRSLRTASDSAKWDDQTSYKAPFNIHLVPDPRTFSNPGGEARITTKTTGSGGIVTGIQLDSTPAGSRNPNRFSFVRCLPMSGVTVGGKFVDKDVTLDITDSPGRVGEIHGKITYLGKPYSISGRRIMGRAGFATFDDSRFGQNGVGTISFYPSMSRALDLRDHNSTETDQVAVFFKFADGSTAAGIHKVLKRAS